MAKLNEPGSRHKTRWTIAAGIAALMLAGMMSTTGVSIAPPDLSLPSAPDCAGPVQDDTPAGRACPTTYGGWRTFFDDGTSQLFHVDTQFADVTDTLPPGVLPPDAEADSHTARAPICVSDPTTEYHNYALYVQPSDAGASNYSAKVASIRTVINSTNGWLRSESDYGFGKMVDYNFRCVGGGDTRVDVAEVRLNLDSSIWSPSAQYSDDIVNDLKSLGFDSTFAKYWIFMDANYGGVCAWGYVPADDEQGNVNNANNVGPGYAKFDNDCWAMYYVMHETSHTLGAVQPGAPNSNYAGTGQHHCTDHQDIMCYSGSVCGTRLGHQRFDCNSNDYFHPGTPTGYLATNWNIGATYQRFMLNQRDCGTAADAPDTFATAVQLTLPQTNCSGALNPDGDVKDWYKFWVGTGIVVKVTLTPNDDADYQVCLYNKDNVQKACSITAGLGTQESITYTTDTGQYWYAKVYVGSGSGNGLYTLSVCKAC